jgi:hypothetical protein
MLEEEERISKILDHFFMKKSLFNEQLRIKCLVSIGGLLDHLHVLLKMKLEDWTPPSSLKFNHTWLDDLEFRELVIKTWKPFDS